MVSSSTAGAAAAGGGAAGGAGGSACGRACGGCRYGPNRSGHNGGLSAPAELNSVVTLLEIHFRQLVLFHQFHDVADALNIEDAFAGWFSFSHTVLITGKNRTGVVLQDYGAIIEALWHG